VQVIFCRLATAGKMNDKKKARKITAVQNMAKRILSVYAEPDGLCAMMLFILRSEATDTAP